MGVGGQRHVPAALLPGKKPVTHCIGWIPRQVWTGTEHLTPPGIDPRTVQPVRSRCTDWAVLDRNNLSQRCLKTQFLQENTPSDNKC
jgi:hypothetical protein